MNEQSVVVWLAPAAVDRAPPHVWLAELGPHERARAGTLKIERDLRRFLASRALLRSALAALCQRPRGDFGFERSVNGSWQVSAPELPWKPFISTAHAGDVVAVAVAAVAVGVDVEAFSPENANEITLWTRQEAAAKMTGEGLLERASMPTGVDTICNASFATTVYACSGSTYACTVAVGNGRLFKPEFRFLEESQAFLLA